MGASVQIENALASGHSEKTSPRRHEDRVQTLDWHFSVRRRADEVTVIDHEPSDWFLLRDGERLLLDVNCSHGAVSYPFLMALNEAEREAYTARGHRFISELARRIDSLGPGVTGYQARNLRGADRSKVNEVILAWTTEQRGAR